MTPDERLRHHVDQFNACVRTGHFEPYTDLFADDGRLKILGSDRDAATGVFTGHGEIAAACTRSLADDTLRIVTVISAKDDAATFDYARGKTPKAVSGQIILKWKDERVGLMTVTKQ